MAINVLMPALSPTMTEGKIAKWHKQVGDAVKPGAVLAESVVPEGTEHVAVNSPIAVLAAEGEKVDAAANGAGTPATQPRPAAAPPAAAKPAPAVRSAPVPAAPAAPAKAPEAEPERTGQTV